MSFDWIWQVSRELDLSIALIAIRSCFAFTEHQVRHLSWMYEKYPAINLDTESVVWLPRRHSNMTKLLWIYKFDIKLSALACLVLDGGKEKQHVVMETRASSLSHLLRRCLSNDFYLRNMPLFVHEAAIFNHLLFSKYNSFRTIRRAESFGH